MDFDGVFRPVEMASAILTALKEEEANTINLYEAFMEDIVAAANESTWVPQDYYVNEIVSDCCSFVKTGKGING